ncbi:putative ABC transporter permease [Anaerocolumna jejuensis]|uniref:putative ABC transporter permease n=1 Tax=Anaerocolumna jejuensis TaxID=259063 RepID=UPI003F7C3237
MISMLKINNNSLKYILFFFVGGFSYCGIETLFRGYSHISMLIAGGVCFLLIDYINQKCKHEIPLPGRMFLSSLAITAVELMAGLIVNLWMHLNVWDYSNQPLNAWGQICPLFSLVWFLLSAPAIWLDNYLQNVIGDSKIVE